jgi:uncharacterized protein (DUF427 family)
MLTPGPEHEITITPTRRRVRARFAGHIIADSDEALVLHETGLPVWHYFPVDDVEMAYLGRTGHIAHCPIKGDAATYTLTMEGDILEDVAKVYEDPQPIAEALRGRIAFDPRRIEVYEIDEDELARSDATHPPTRLTAI